MLATTMGDIFAGVPPDDRRRPHSAVTFHELYTVAACVENQ